MLVRCGPRTGSPITPRNKGLGIDRGKYIVFPADDATLASGSLERVHNAISSRPGTDLYRCSLAHGDEMAGQADLRQDYHPVGFMGELTGSAVPRRVYPLTSSLCPMMQMTIYLRAFLNDNHLRCGDGLRHEDNEVAPRALYFATRIVPLHEKFYIYWVRRNSTMPTGKDMERFVDDMSREVSSLLAFHAHVSREVGSDKNISAPWSRLGLERLFFYWFPPGMAKFRAGGEWKRGKRSSRMGSATSTPTSGHLQCHGKWHRSSSHWPSATRRCHGLRGVPPIRLLSADRPSGRIA